MDRATELLVEFHGMKPLAEYAASLEKVLATSYEQQTQRIIDREKQIAKLTRDLVAALDLAYGQKTQRTIELEEQIKTLTTEALQREKDFLLQLVNIKKTFTANRY